MVWIPLIGTKYTLTEQILQIKLNLTLVKTATTNEFLFFFSRYTIIIFFFFLEVFVYFLVWDMTDEVLFDLQSLDPLPMHGRDLGMNPDDLIQPPEQEEESKQEILENKDVSNSILFCFVLLLFYLFK